MLDPRDRKLLLESLRPPDGYHFDEAIGTSYSLDLLALLSAPLAFTFFDWEDKEGKPTADPYALLEAIRRHAGRIHLFCQAGEIKLPPPEQRLVAFLEKSVIPVRAPIERGIFHPKMWVVRYLAEGSPVHYRLVCLTRNLTFDRCWDTVLVLDGKLQDRKNAISSLHPLGEFIEALPNLAFHPIPPTLNEKIARIAQEIRRVEFDPPENIEQIEFWPLGIPGHRKSPLDDKELNGPLLVVSPFISPSMAKKLTKRKSHSILISRSDEIEKLPPEVLPQFREVYFLSNTAEDPEEDREDDSRTGLSGLHAKLFVVDAGWDSHIFTGSANATDAAFNRNVEFMVELIGKKSKAGIDCILGEEGKKEGMRPLLERWSANPRELSEEQIVRERLEEELTGLRRALAILPMALKCAAVPDKKDVYELQLHSPRALPSPGKARMRFWLSSLRQETGVSPALSAGLLATFGPMSLESISGFLACELSASEGSVTCTSRFVLNLPLEGAPNDRLQKLLASQLGDKAKLLRFIMLLLEAGNATVDFSSMLGARTEGEESPDSWSDGNPLFERLVQALVDSKQSLNEVGNLIEDLAKTEEGRKAIPAPLLHLWQELKTCMEDARGPT